MSNLKQLLKTAPVFCHLEDADLDRILPCFRPRTLSVGDEITTRGENTQYFFLLENGCLLLALEDGRALVLESPGAFAGMELLSVKGVYRTTTTVLSAGRAFAIAREDFLAFIQEDTPAAAGVMAAWQAVLDSTAAFAREIEGNGFPEHI